MKRESSPFPARAFLGACALLAWPPLVLTAAEIEETSTRNRVKAALADFHQQGSGVCVHYAHIIAWAEWDPNGFLKTIVPVDDGWDVRLADGSVVRVEGAEERLSLEKKFSGGSPGNPVNIVAIAASKAGGGFDPETGRLTYGDNNGDPKNFIGSPRWTLYDNHQEAPDRTWHDGLDRLLREARPDGTPGRPSTVGFADLGRPDEIREIAVRCGLVGAHDFTVSGCDPRTGRIRLRNPHRPTKTLEVPVDDLKQLPGGIDFMEKAPAPHGD